MLAIWLVLYLLRKDTRKEMWAASLYVGIASPLTAFLWWTRGWWLPPNITGTRVGIEDFILGFACGGIAAVLYEEIFKKEFRPRKGKRHDLGFILLSLFMFGGIAFGFNVLGLPSFWATAVSLFETAVIFMVLRRDLFWDALGSAVFMTLACLPFYFTAMAVSSEWIGATYDVGNLSGQLAMGIPIEELVFFFLFGFLAGPAYEYWQNERLIKR